MSKASRAFMLAIMLTVFLGMFFWIDWPDYNKAYLKRIERDLVEMQAALKRMDEAVYAFYPWIDTNTPINMERYWVGGKEMYLERR